MLVLLVGGRAFAAQGLAAALEKRGHKVVSVKSGDLANCAGLTPDAVVNFSLQNIDGLQALHRFMENTGCKRLIQVSSLAVYRIYPAPETGYAAVKIAQDRFFRQVRRSYAVAFIRPGVLYTPDGQTRTGGIGKLLFRRPFACGIVYGSADTPLAICKIETFHRELAALLENPGSKREVKLAGERTTKRAFLKFLHGGGLWLCMPHCLAALAAAFLPRNLRFKMLGLFHRPQCRIFPLR